VRIECDRCVMQGTEQCRDCVVSFILESEDGVVEVSSEEARAIRSLGNAGLVPLLRLVPRTKDGEAEGEREAG
jgi:hypothetical protein